jgi:hypothetical protein
MGNLMAIDPGNCSGVAYFENNQLEWVSLFRDFTWPMGSFRIWNHVDELIVEIPQIYDRKNWKGDPNDEIKVAVKAGILERNFNPDKLTEVFPHQWKGNRPKKVHCLYILSLLLPQEKLVLERDLKKSFEVIKAEISQEKSTKTHNAIDAIGIGLWKLKRA